MSKNYRVCSEKGCRRKALGEKVPQPHEYHYGRHLTFFGWTLFVYKNTAEYQTDICLDCSIDLDNYRRKETYDAGFNDGVERAEEAR